MSKQEYFAAIEVNNKVVASEWCSSFKKAKEWIEAKWIASSIADEYTLLIYRGNEADPIFKIQQPSLF